jgi:hypothetical protein
MLRLLLHYARSAREALGQGAPLEAILKADLDERLLRLGEVPAAEIEAKGPALETEIDSTLQGIERT